MLVNKVTGASPEDKQIREMFESLGIKDKYQQPAWPLPNMKSSTEEEYWGWRASYTFSIEIWVGSVQIDGQWANLLLYWLGHSHFIGGGFAVAVFRQYREERVQYYEWRACDHKFEEKSIGHCLTKSTCKKCGRSFETDSSG